MRLRLLRRRLTISAPRVAIRSAMPWPLRWLALAVVFGFCAAVALWAFDLGKSIAGLDRVSPGEVLALRSEIARLREQHQQQEVVEHSAQSLLIAERAAKESLMSQVRGLEADNRSLREDLGFFEKLLPVARTEGLAIRSVQAEVIGDMQLRWQVLVIQSTRNAPEFNGRLELVFTGTRNGEVWTEVQATGGQPLQVSQYRRIEGIFVLPPHAVVKTVTARVLDGKAVRATQAIAVAVAVASNQ